MKVKIMQRSVYHKYAEIEIEVPNDIKDDDMQSWLLENEYLYTGKIDDKIHEAEYEFGFGLDNDAGLDEKDNESEWRFEYGDRYGGHL